MTAAKDGEAVSCGLPMLLRKDVKASPLGYRDERRFPNAVYTGGFCFCHSRG
jgi:hypothetical protein